MFDAQAMAPFFSVFRNETPRACGILAGSLLEVCLERLLSSAMLRKRSRLFTQNAPLATFSGKIGVAGAFGLISTEEERDLELIRRVRNDFAHSVEPGLSFDTLAIAQRVAQLALPKILFDHPTLSVSADTVRLRFEIGVGILY